MEILVKQIILKNEKLKPAPGSCCLWHICRPDDHPEFHPGKCQLGSLLLELVEFTHLHFSTEEKYMKQNADPSLNLHHKEHRSLLRHLDQLVAGVAKGQTPTFFSDYDLSSDWMMSHITEYDIEMGRYLNSKGVY